MNRKRLIQLVVLRNLVALIVLAPILYFTWWQPFTQAEEFRELLLIQARTTVLLLLVAGVNSLLFLPFMGKATGFSVRRLLANTRPTKEVRVSTEDPFRLDS